MITLSCDGIERGAKKKDKEHLIAKLGRRKLQLKCKFCFVFQRSFADKFSVSWAFFRHEQHVSLKMISSPYCAVSEPNVYKHYKRLTRWNAYRCHSLRITYLIFETFQTLFPTASLIFTAVKVSSSDISKRMKLKSFALKMAVDMKL